MTSRREIDRLRVELVEAYEREDYETWSRAVVAMRRLISGDSEARTRRLAEAARRAREAADRVVPLGESRRASRVRIYATLAVLDEVPNYQGKNADVGRTFYDGDHSGTGVCALSARRSSIPWWRPAAFLKVRAAAREGWFG